MERAKHSCVCVFEPLHLLSICIIYVLKMFINFPVLCPRTVEMRWSVSREFIVHDALMSLQSGHALKGLTKYMAFEHLYFSTSWSSCSDRSKGL